MFNLSKLTKTLSAVVIMLIHQGNPFAQSIAREWNETQLACIRKSFARPTVHARALFHVSIAMYDAWAVYDTEAIPFMLGRTWEGNVVPYNGIPSVGPNDTEAFREEAISYAAYRVLMHLYVENQQMTIVGQLSNVEDIINNQMTSLGYSTAITNTDYSTGSPAALGNYIAQQLIQFESIDGSNQINNYANQVYHTVNGDILPNEFGDPMNYNLNRWQRMVLPVCQDQSGGTFDTCPEALTPEWSNVAPFSLTECQATYFKRDSSAYFIDPDLKNSPASDTIHQDSLQWKVYLDPGFPPYVEDTNFTIDPTFGPRVNLFKWGYVMNIIWHSFHNNNDGVMVDISPASTGGLNITAANQLPQTFEDYQSFYNVFGGGAADPGHSINPITGSPYQPQIVPRMDFTRVLAQYWADGPNSETPPGHWFAIANKVADKMDSLNMPKKWMNEGNALDNLEWDVRTYFTLGGGVHDAAIACWGVKGAYDYTRPIMAIRTMGALGQCTDPALPHYHENGLPLIPGFIELIQPGDPLAGSSNQFENFIKIFTWRGPYGFQPSTTLMWQGTQEDSAGWIHAEDWWPYQTASFVTPPFPGYYSGHSVYSRTSAELLTRITGSEYFPGGMYEFTANTDYLIADTATIAPTQPITLQWATYRDASDQCSLSRIYGGLHPPQDDIPGRKVGMALGQQVFDYANTFMNANAPQAEAISVENTTGMDGGPAMEVTMTFTQTCDVSTNPQLIISPQSAAALLSQTTGAWINDNTFTATFESLDATAEIGPITIQATNVIPNDLLIYGTCSPDTLNIQSNTSSYPITIDLTAPQCNALAPSVSIADTQVGETYSFSLSFTELVDPASFVNGSPLSNPGFNTTFQFIDTTWLNATTIEYHFAIVDNNEEVTLTTDELISGTDLAGNSLISCAIQQVYEVDTRNPLIAQLLVSPDVIDNTNCEDGMSITVIYDETMAPSPLPTLELSAGSPPLTPVDDGSWNSDFTEFTLNYTCDGSYESTTGIDITLGSNPTDVAGNSSMDATYNDVFSIDIIIGLREDVLGGINLYPNPTNGSRQVVVEANGIPMSSIHVYDAMGRMVWSNRPHGQIALLPSDTWRAGLYSIVIQTVGQPIVKSLVINSGD